MLRRVIVLTFDDIRLIAEAIRDIEPGIRYWSCSRPERRHALGLRYQTMGTSGEKIEYGEGLDLRTIFSVLCLSDWFGVSSEF